MATSITARIKRWKYPILGFFLLGLFFAQLTFNFEWPWLDRKQTEQNYRLISGFTIFAFIAAQWWLSVLRFRGKMKTATKYYKLHKYLGVLGPLFFYFHSTTLGFAYIFFLSLIFFGNTVVGILNPEIIHIPRKWFGFYWMIVHVLLSVLTVMIMFYHIFIVFYYK